MPFLVLCSRSSRRILPTLTSFLTFLRKKKLHTEVVARLIREKHPEVFPTQQQVN